MRDDTKPPPAHPAGQGAPETALPLTASTCERLRRALGWTEQDLAIRAGVSERTVRNFEARQGVPHRATLLALRRAFAAEGVELRLGRPGAYATATPVADRYGQSLGGARPGPRGGAAPGGAPVPTGWGPAGRARAAAGG
ncbi:helix-turn-helix transcriptional regulator [Roseomonas sp. CCTCC AB2023176]|uniref:helix-turn-helix transcriptional regulator n=1 Tax=Roseomonas sp. CCTCC AB2023176 TaxID=3342640 RepID=UPI0035DE648A